MLLSLLLAFAAPFFLATRTNAETHTIKFVNNCGFGSPALIYGGSNILQGDTYTNETFSGIAYLQTGYCNTNGENCTLLETTLINPTKPGGGSSTDISLITPHVYSVETSFAYYNGCDGQGKTCNAAYCPGDAFYQPDDTYVQVGCETNDVNLLVAFCANASLIVSPNSAVPPSSPGDTTLTSPVVPSPTTSSSSPTSTPAASSSPSSSLPNASTPAATTSTPGALSVSPTGSATVSASPSTTPHQCHPKTSSVPPVPNPTPATSVSAGTTSPTAVSSPPPFSAPTVATPAPTSTPGALNVSPTGSATGEPNPTGTSPRRCRPRTSSVPPALAPTTTPTATDTLAPSPATTTTATAGNNPPPKQCRAPSPTPSTSPSTPTPLRHRRARHARLPLTH